MKLSNITGIIDELGFIRAAKAELDKKEEAIKEALKELDEGAYEGNKFVLTVFETTRQILDQKLLAAEMGEDWDNWFEAYSRKTQVRTLRTSLAR